MRAGSSAGGKRLSATGGNDRLLRLIAHRGFAAEYPENTLAAVRRSGERADAVEVDARRCGSGEIVVIHDETVDRVSDETGRVDAFTADELAGLSVLGSGEGVPLLADVAAALPEETGLLVELKETAIAADAIQAVGSEDDFVVCSFHTAALRACRAADPGVSVALNVVESTGVEAALDLGCDAIQPHVDSCSPAFVRRAHDAGLRVTAWTVEDRGTARALSAAGVDGIMADSAAVIE